MPISLIFWHQDIPAIIRAVKNYPSFVLMSKSNDGSIMTYLVEKMGSKPVRGSSSRGAIAGLKNLTKQLTEKQHKYYFCCFSADGPKGPAKIAKPGAFFVAKVKKTPLVIVKITMSSCWKLNTWDKMRIPKPFSKVSCFVSGPLSAENLELKDVQNYIENFHPTQPS